ncbi:MAG: uncharacterized membrane protein YgdD (TMEM256/DUF423 family) [Saprospiraceae bacterium]|jgi:uncharacterized membrane protein YgdD (TMEM256/DUF423 family)
MSNLENYKKPILTALISLAIAVIIGAFGAHIIAERISDHYMAIYKTGSLYHYVHSLGWLLVIVICIQIGIHELKWINVLFLLGLVLFCGSLYVISFNEILEMPILRKFGAIAPIGGIAFVAAWLLSAYKVYRKLK